MNFIALTRARVMKGEKDIDLDLIYKLVSGKELKLYEGSMQMHIGEILLNIDDQDRDEAEAWIKNSIETYKKNDMKWSLGRGYALYAELFKRKGDQLKAIENLSKAIEIFKECGADGWVEKYEKELAVIS